jgi:hypothetical protein
MIPIPLAEDFQVLYNPIGGSTDVAKQLSFEEFKAQNDAKIAAIAAYDAAVKTHADALERLEPLVQAVTAAADALVDLGFKDPRKKARAVKADGTPKATRAPREFGSVVMTAAKGMLAREHRKGTPRKKAEDSALKQAEQLAKNKKETLTAAHKSAISSYAAELWFVEQRRDPDRVRVEIARR